MQPIPDLIRQMTLEEKARFCSGRNFWFLKALERLEIPAIMLTDGPHGLRKQAGAADHVGLNKSVPATCFPTASALAATWNRDLVFQVGQALAEEYLQESVSVILGPPTPTSKTFPPLRPQLQIFFRGPLSQRGDCQPSSLQSLGSAHHWYSR